MSSGEEEIELFNGFGASSFEKQPLQSGRRTKKRWSFHDSLKTDLVGIQAEVPSSPRRLSDITGIDAVHKEIDPFHISPAQLYSTESGRLFHAGKICIALAGLPGRGKTHLSVSLTRYLRWLGVKTHSFHLGDYRRANADDLQHDLFVPSPNTPRANDIRKKIVNECYNDMFNFFKKDKGQVAIYDAVNSLPEYRTDLHNKFSAMNIQVLFIESLVTDDTIVMRNMESAARSSPDYNKWDYEKAYHDYSERIRILTPFYQEMGSENLSYIKFINFGERIELHNSNYGYLINKVVFFLMNSRIKNGSVFFAPINTIDNSQDPSFDESVKAYSRNMAKTLIEHLKLRGSSNLDDTKNRPQVKRQLSIEERHPAAGVDGTDSESFVVWTSVRRLNFEAAKYFSKMNIKVRPRIQLSSKNLGVVANMSENEIQEKFPSEYEQFLKDPYHHRFSRAESYHDLAIKIEPLILEMERMSGDILIIADESVLRVFYGYLMSSSCYDIPSLNFKSDEIIEVKFNAYSNSAERIPIKNFH